MKSAIVFSGTGPILILTTYESLTHPAFVKKLAAKGINKFVAVELPVEKVKEKYADNFNIVMEDLHQTDDLRVLDYNGHSIMNAFSMKEWGSANPLRTIGYSLQVAGRRKQKRQSGKFELPFYYFDLLCEGCKP